MCKLMSEFLYVNVNICVVSWPSWPFENLIKLVTKFACILTDHNYFGFSVCQIWGQSLPGCMEKDKLFFVPGFRRGPKKLKMVLDEEGEHGKNTQKHTSWGPNFVKIDVKLLFFLFFKEHLTEGKIGGGANSDPKEGDEYQNGALMVSVLARWGGFNSPSPQKTKQTGTKTEAQHLRAPSFKTNWC